MYNTFENTMTSTTTAFVYVYVSMALNNE